MAQILVIEDSLAERRMLEKPFSAAEILTAVHEVLAG
jgi:hypothetical protein